MLGFDERGKVENPEKNTPEQSSRPANSIHKKLLVQKWIPGHEDRRPVLSPLSQPTLQFTHSPITLLFYGYILLIFFIRSDNVYALDDYHGWFKQSVTRWFDIAQVKAKERIRKAVEIDQVLTFWRRSR